MKVLTPKPLDAKRARKDVIYFSENYLERGLSQPQADFVYQIIAGDKVNLAGVAGNKTIVEVALAFGRHLGMPIRTEHDVIDGESRIL